MAKLPRVGTIWGLHGNLWRVEKLNDRYVLLRGLRSDLSARIPRSMWPGNYFPAWPPRVGSIWDYVPPDLVQPWSREPSFQVQVIAAGRTGARLLDLWVGTQLDVPKEEWPGDFMPHYDWSTHPSRTFKALLVGGATGRHLTRLKKQASILSVDIEDHVPYDKTTGERKGWTIGPDIDVVLVLTSHMSHALYHRAVNQAKEQGVPLILLTSSDFMPQLWEGMRDPFPMHYSTDYFGFVPPSQRSPIDPGNMTRTWTDRGWQWLRDVPLEQPEPVQDGDRAVAVLLGFAGVASIMWRGA